MAELQLFEVLHSMAKSDDAVCKQLAFECVYKGVQPGQELLIKTLPKKLVDAKSALLRDGEFVTRLVNVLRASFSGLDESQNGAPECTCKLDTKSKYEGFQILLRYAEFLHDGTDAQAKAVVLTMLNEDHGRIYLDLLKQLGTPKLGVLIQDEDVILAAVRQQCRDAYRVPIPICILLASSIDIFPSIPYRGRSLAVCTARIDSERERLTLQTNRDHRAKEMKMMFAIRTQEELLSCFGFLSIEIPEEVQRHAAYIDSCAEYLKELKRAVRPPIHASYFDELVQKYLPHQINVKPAKKVKH
eukprot:g4817.t1